MTISPAKIARVYHNTYWYSHSCHDPAKAPHIIENRNRVAARLGLGEWLHHGRCARIAINNWDHCEWYRTPASRVMMCHEYDTRPEAIKVMLGLGFLCLPSLYCDDCTSYILSGHTARDLCVRLKQAASTYKERMRGIDRARALAASAGALSDPVERVG